MNNYKALEHAIGYNFKDSALLERALTHPSLHAESNYQRLEFLGDSIVGFVIAKELCRLFPKEGEGTLTLMRSRIVGEKPLSIAADRLNISDFIRVGEPEEKNKIHALASVKSDVFEAIAAAIYLDGGMEKSEEFVIKALANEILQAKEAPSQRDPKSALNEYAQKHDVEVTYLELAMTGKPHSPIYTYTVQINGKEYGKGTGTTKRTAQQNAAKKALAFLKAKN